MRRQSRQVWIGFDLGGTKMLACLFDDAMRPRARVKRPAKGREGAKAGLKKIADMVDEILIEARVDARALGGIGIGCPGPVDPARGLLLGPPNLGWGAVKVRQSLSRRFDCHVAVANDVDAGTFGEAQYGAGRGARCVLGAFPGTGVGGGCVYEGRIIRGASRSCMELGHIQVAPEGPLCGCGRRGCLETLASRLAISAEAAKAVFRGQAPALAKAAGADLTKIRSGALAAAIRGGDRVVEEIVREAARWLGVGVAAAVNLLAPDVVVLGGGLVGAMPQLYRKEVTAAAKVRVMASLRGCFSVAVGELGDDAIVMGAAAWARAESGGRP